MWLSWYETLTEFIVHYLCLIFDINKGIIRYRPRVDGRSACDMILEGFKVATENMKFTNSATNYRFNHDQNPR